MPQPKETTTDLINTLNDLVRRGERDDLIIRRIKRETDRLKSTDATSAYLLLGMIACLERDLSTSQKYHRMALNLSSTYFTNVNYGLSLSRFGAVSEATHYLERAVKLEPENITALEVLIDNVFSACRFRHTRDLLNKWKFLKPGQTHPLEKSIAGYVAVLEGHEVLDEEAESLIKLVSEQMLANSLYPRSAGSATDLQILEEDSAKWLDYSLNIEGNVDEAVEMNCGLADIVAGKVVPKVLKSIVVRYSVAQD
ncbi:MAG: hypothetical protein ACYC9L_01100 [Sulfuricaulis sp.]